MGFGVRDIAPRDVERGRPDKPECQRVEGYRSDRGVPFLPDQPDQQGADEKSEHLLCRIEQFVPIRFPAHVTTNGALASDLHNMPTTVPI